VTPDPVTAPGARWRLAGVGVFLAAVLGLTACGQQTPSSVAAHVAGGGTTKTGGDMTKSDLVVRLAVGEDKPRLRCPTDARSLMIADFAMGAKGAASPEEAVGLWSLEHGEHMVVSPPGTRAWIVRGDGTAREEIHLLRMRGWVLHMRKSCA
jgi:hypothetical protein